MRSFTVPGQPDRDVVITGIGMVTPLGIDTAATWARMQSGALGSRPLQPDEIDAFQQLTAVEGLQVAGAPVPHRHVQTACLQRLRNAVSAELLDCLPTAVWLQEPVVAMTLHAAMEAAEDAGLSFPVHQPERTACYIGASKSGLRSAEWLVRQFTGSRNTVSPARLTELDAYQIQQPTDPFAEVWWHAFQTDAACRAVSAIAGIKGAAITPVAACATGLVSLLQAAAAVQSGQFDVCFAGSGDAGLRASVLASFHRLRVTSRSPDPATACRPFDRHRDGFLIGEGAAVFVLESRQHAEARGAVVAARVTAGGWLSDPSGMTQIDTSGQIVAELLQRTVHAVHESAGENTVDYINLHGTGTQANDLAEARGIHRAFGSSIPHCSGMKGSLGHLLGAAGSVEAALTVRALQSGWFPATANLREPDPECAIPLLTSDWKYPQAMRAAKLSLGFGGHVACGVFDREIS